MKKYEFSIPMPYSTQNIDRLISINNEIEKSEIKMLFFSLPSTCNLYTGFEQPRNMMLNYSDFEFWNNMITYALDKSFDIIYNFNLARPLDYQNPSFSKQLEKLDVLLSKLLQNGVNKLRIYNIQLLEHIAKEYPQFELYISTVANYNNIHQFKNIKNLYPNVKQIVPAQDINKNFQLLDNIKNKLNIDIEIMLNDACLQGCLDFFNHHGMTDYYNNKLIACMKHCNVLENQNPVLYFTKGNTIYPWEIKEYAKIGITKFKLTGRDRIHNINSVEAINLYRTYLKGIDNINNIKDYPIVLFLNNFKANKGLDILLCKDVIHSMPNINYFKKYGHLCASRCGVECRYCYKCAEKIQKIFEKKQEEQRKRTMPFCVMSK